MDVLQPDPAELKAMQDDNYLEKVLRARKMTAEERFAAGLELSNAVFRRILEGAMRQLNTGDEAKGWAEVRRRLAVISRIHEEGRFVSEKPSDR